MTVYLVRINSFCKMFTKEFTQNTVFGKIHLDHQLGGQTVELLGRITGGLKAELKAEVLEEQNPAG